MFVMHERKLIVLYTTLFNVVVNRLRSLLKTGVPEGREK